MTMIYFQVNENCNGCLACVQNCPARALDAKEAGGVQTLFHNMARCARCATCWRICPEHAIEFQHMLQNRWDEVVTHTLVRCEVCGEAVHAERLTDSLDAMIWRTGFPIRSTTRACRRILWLIPLRDNAKTI
jgi:flavoprotein